MLVESSPMIGESKKDASERPAAITDIGCEREINEDRYAVLNTRHGNLWIVCDGMGGCVGGELAAQLAVDTIKRSVEASGADSAEELISTAFEEANRLVVLRRQNPAFSSMGTTIVGVVINEDEVIFAHAGDSRAYLVRDGDIQQITVDHTYVQDLVDRGEISHEEAMSHPQSHVLTRCLGSQPRIDLDLKRYWLWDKESGAFSSDRLVLCSDGLYSLVSDKEIATVVSKCSPEEACEKLVELARNRGGFDNITVMIVPLSGEMREEKSPKSIMTSQSKSTSKKKTIPITKIAKLSSAQKFAIMFSLAVFSCLIALIWVLFQAAS